MELHKLLRRQLKKMDLNEDSFPDNIKEWKNFLEHINMTYIESDQERYLNERSINISSRELLRLNEKLENAQHIAQLGYWVYDESTKKITLSKELFNLFGLDPVSVTSILDFKDFLQLIHAENRDDLAYYIKRIQSDKSSFEIELRILHPDKKDHWFNMIGNPFYKYSKLSTQVTGIAMDITSHKFAELEIANLNQQLISAARQAGMADIASAILHNVGNILNSANVSLTILQEKINQDEFKKLIAVLKLLKENRKEIINYLTEDAKGKLIPRYLIAILDPLKNNYMILNEEINNLITDLHHIKEIVSLQQNYAGVSGVEEKIFLPEVVDAALQMSGYLTFPKNIVVKKCYKKLPFILTDKSKLLSILVNIIRNAKESVLADHEKVHKEIKLYITANNSKKESKIIISDNGVGITKENLVKIFTFGYTTKMKGHGIGLHTSALSAKEIGGHLKAESDGAGQGAIFTLTLPSYGQKKDSNNGRK